MSEHTNPIETAKIIAQGIANLFKRKPRQPLVNKLDAILGGKSAFDGATDWFDEQVEKLQGDVAGGNISINGKTYSGKRIKVERNKITVDGKDVTPDEKTINIVVNGNVDSLDVDACESVAVTGSTKKIETMSGDVTCGAVTGSVRTMSGDVFCTTIGGDVETMSGNISRR